MTAIKRILDNVVEQVFTADAQLGQNVQEGRDADGNLIVNFRRLYTQMYPYQKLIEDQFVLDNADTFTGDAAITPTIAIGRELAKDMGWIYEVVDYKGDLQVGLGVNLRPDFPTDIIPTATDLDPTGDVFWKVDADSLQLSCFCNWVFSYVNESFEEAYGSAERLLFVFSNLVESSTYAEQITNILRDVPYQVQQKCYEMDRMHYMSLRSELVDIIEIAIKEEDGSSPHFRSGNTILTLHFKYEP